MMPASDVEPAARDVFAAAQPLPRLAARALNRQIEGLRLGSKLLLLPIDSPTVHDMRVAARRSRAALRAFRRWVGKDRRALRR